MRHNEEKVVKNMSSRSHRLSRFLILILFLILLLPYSKVYASQKTNLEFYVISCNVCPDYIERVEILENTHPQESIKFYELQEEINVKRFKKISDFLGEVLSIPLVGIIKNDTLIAIASGDLSADDWRYVVEEQSEGVPVYVSDLKGLEIKAVIIDPEDIAFIKRLFIESDVIVTDVGGFFSLLPVVVIAAIVDAFNPCCFTIFVILLSFVFYGVGKKSVLKIGLAFTIALFISYFILGLGLSRIFPHVPQIKYIAAAFSLLIGGLRIIEGLGIKVKHIPSAFTGIISKQLESVSNPRTGFIAGIVVGFLMLPCSSAPYFIVLSLLSERASLMNGMLLLGLYNLIIITPFLILTLIVHTLTRTTRELKLWSLEKNKWINLLMGLVLILLGLLNAVG